MGGVASPRTIWRLTPQVAVLLLIAAIAWVAIITWTQQSGDMTGTMGLALPAFVVAWTVMMAAMMLPSVAPMTLLFARISRDRRGKGQAFVPTWVFLAGYLAVWTVYGLAAYGLFRLVTAFGTGWLAWHGAGPYVAGGAIVAAGLYQLTPLKEVCLRHCRGPMHYVLHGWRDGKLGALRMGGEHGLFCVGCCWGLMVALFAVGVMSLFWMAVVAAVIFAEKVLPYGLRLSRVIALVLVALGIWIAMAPGSVPGLTDPAAPGSPSMQMSP